MYRQIKQIKGPESDRITLPKMYDPLADLNQLEASFLFSSKTFKQMPKKTEQEVSVILSACIALPPNFCYVPKKLFKAIVPTCKHGVFATC